MRIPNVRYPKNEDIVNLFFLPNFSGMYSIWISHCLRAMQLGFPPIQPKIVLIVLCCQKTIIHQELCVNTCYEQSTPVLAEEGIYYWRWDLQVAWAKDPYEE